jgi:basic amino acid/polyamine antiporter, APA family
MEVWNERWSVDFPHDTTAGVTSVVQDTSSGALRRELGRWDLTAIGVNQVIGGAVFALPAALAASAGGWSPWVIAAIGGASMLTALSFAEVASRFDATGGPYLYTRAAFGRFPAFEVGWLMWFSRAASWASVINVLVASLGFYWPVVTAGAPRVALLAAIMLAIAAVNIRGIKQSSVVLNALTIAKLTPLVIFVCVGIFFVDAARLATGPLPPIAQLSGSGLLLIFAFGGYEVATVPAGEARDPRRAVPFALVMTIVIVTIVMTLVQVVALGTLPGVAASRTPLADAAALFWGASGAALITMGAVFSTTGNNMGQALSGSRNLYALAEQGDLPRFFGRVHPIFRTPVTAIVITASVSFVLATTGTFAAMAEVSAMARLLVYVATCLSAIRLRAARFAGVVNPAKFVLPLGPVIPLCAIAVALAILAGASTRQLMAGVLAISVGAVLYVIAVRSPRGIP